MRKLFRFIKWIVWLCAISLGIALFISYASIYVPPIRFWIPAFFGLYFVPLVIVNALFLLIFFVKRSRIAWIPFIALLPTLLFAEFFVRWGPHGESLPPPSLTIASYNVCNFQGYGTKTREETMAEIGRFLQREQVDIVCMQEFFCADTARIGILFPSFPYRFYPKKGVGKSYKGNIILSRIPIENAQELPFLDSRRSCLFADFNHNGQLFRVYTTHLESNNISLNALIDRIRHYQEVPDEFLQAHRRIREAFRLRTLQVEAISQHIETITKPFILCGDFNDTPVSYTYHRLQRGITDSFRQAGYGFGATFRYLWPSLRIDYILYNSAFTAKTHTTARVPFSDHYPVITELIIL
ncbi:MAG: endonuclease/exonuclease/phosphatase family protein [Prevotellaceae bacterium]|jgi:endonuclease/exonuclease/phosphatase family metal-dependent hydrolase|nr:endonuclease/exonuclease/phosphatase family protein [Prevotellaceae bacterium]